MKVLFWNLHNKENSFCLSELVHELSVDVIIVAEYRNLNKEKFLSQNTEYGLSRDMGVESKVIAFHKNSCVFKVFREQSRYALYVAEYNGEKYNIVGVHLQDSFYSDSEARKDEISHLVPDIIEMERMEDNDKTIVIGDFNASPFDAELINKNMFNAVLFRRLILEKEYDTCNGRRYRRFYNPSLTMISEQSQSYGSYYNSGKMYDLHWYSIDQVLVRKSLCDRLSDLKYIRMVENRSFCTKTGHPDKNYSDHFQVYVEVK